MADLKMLPSNAFMVQVFVAVRSGCFQSIFE